MNNAKLLIDKPYYPKERGPGACYIWKMYRTGIIGIICASCAPMQTTSTIQHTPAGDVELPATITEISDPLDATTSLSGTSLAVAVFERRQCERKKIARTRVETSTKSAPSRGWIALEAASTLAAGMLWASVDTSTHSCSGEFEECLGSGIGDGISTSIKRSMYGSLFVGGIAATTADLFRGGTTHKQEIKEQILTEVFDCSQAVGAGIEVALRSPGTRQLQAYTDPAGRVTIDLGEQRLPLELWINDKPLRMISSQTRKP